MKVTLVVVHGGTDEEAQQHLVKELGVPEKELEELAGDARDGFFFRILPDDNKYKTNCSFMWLKDSRNHDTILHESIHLVTSLFDERGIPLRHENDEILAYYLTYWFRTIKTMMRHK